MATDIANNMKIVPIIKGDKREAMSISFAFFNQLSKHYKRAKNGFIRRFGLAAWKKTGIEEAEKTGIMVVLNWKITEEIRWFVETVCFLVNEEYCTRKKD